MPWWRLGRPKRGSMATGPARRRHGKQAGSRRGFGGQKGRRAGRPVPLHRLPLPGGSLDNVYDATFEAILDGLRCERASILLFDDTGVMRFIAWRGLSEAYRRAVDGHSPWKPGDRGAAPIFVDDIDASAESEALKAIVERGLRALAFIPLTSNGAVIGKFMTYYGARHDFTENETELALTIARQLAFQHRAQSRRRGAPDRRSRAAPQQEQAEADPRQRQGLRDHNFRRRWPHSELEQRRGAASSATKGPKSSVGRGPFLHPGGQRGRSSRTGNADGA